MLSVMTWTKSHFSFMALTDQSMVPWKLLTNTWRCVHSILKKNFFAMMQALDDSIAIDNIIRG